MLTAAPPGIPFGAKGPFSIFLQEVYQGRTPLEAIRARATTAEVTYRTGRYVSEAVEAAKKADVAIVFATQWTTEGFDVPDLSLPNGQDALIEAVAKANPHTVVVLETGSAVSMPWLNKAAAVIEAWYPGAQGGDVVASVLFGVTNPSGRLPITFPADIEQLPRPKLDGSDTLEPNPHVSKTDHPLVIDYNVEGSDVGYRWYARNRLEPLFPFGFGLSYTNFVHSAPRFTATGASITVTNVGSRAGADVAQLYLTQRPAGATRRLVGFAKVALQPGESRTVTVPIDHRIVADWTDKGWHIVGGSYRFAFGRNASDLDDEGSVQMALATWR
jgi:beta-glucosidase